LLWRRARQGPAGAAGPERTRHSTQRRQTPAFAFTGNADVDFVKEMIPLRQGAVDMAKTVLAFGKDPEVKKIAEDIISAQEVEITWMKEWLKKQGE